MTERALYVAPIVSALFEENAYVVWREAGGGAVVIDPGADAEKIDAFLRENRLRLAAILNTHGHADHIAGNGYLKQCWPEAPLVIGRQEVDKLRDSAANLSEPFGLPIASPPADRLVDEGDEIEYAGIRFRVRATPGHSAGHVVYLVDEAEPWRVFGGDVLFAGGIGRSDFPDSDPRALVRSIEQVLYRLPDETIVYPGHGPETTIGQERRTNPWVRG